MRRALCLLLALLLTLGCAPAALAADADETPAFVDAEELTALLESARKEAYPGAAALSVAVLFTRSGESFFYNADAWYYSASLYKLPMIMRFSRMVEDGGLEDANPVFLEKAETIKERCLVYSDNSWASSLWRLVFNGPDSIQRAALDYAQFPEEELPEDYYERTQYSARFLLGLLEELYENSGEYPGVLDYMKQAQPGQYFRGELEGRYDVAQKYGSAEGVNHAAGMIWTPSPILLVVLTNGMGARQGDLVIAHVAAAVADYALQVDERADTWDKLLADAEAEDAAAAEQARAQAVAKARDSAAQAGAAPQEPEAAARRVPWQPALLIVPAAALGFWALKRRHKKES